jgi:hypothetical protein
MSVSTRTLATVPLVTVRAVRVRVCAEGGCQCRGQIRALQTHADAAVAVHEASGSNSHLLARMPRPFIMCR